MQCLILIILGWEKYYGRKGKSEYLKWNEDCLVYIEIILVFWSSGEERQSRVCNCLYWDLREVKAGEKLGDKIDKHLHRYFEIF